MLSRLRAALRPDDRGSPNGGRVVRINLVLVLLFVVVAVIELTRTAVAAAHIASATNTIDTRLNPVIDNTQQVQRLKRTTEITGRILQASNPLGRQTLQLDQTVADINTGVQQIQPTAGAINGQVHQITDKIGPLNTTVSTLLDTVHSITAVANSIEGDARGINQSFAALDPTTQMIAFGPPPFGVNTINLNTDVVIGQARGIRADLDNVLISVREIDGHTISICRALIIMGRHCDPQPQPVPAHPPGPGSAGVAGAGTPTAGAARGAGGTR